MPPASASLHRRNAICTQFQRSGVAEPRRHLGRANDVGHQHAAQSMVHVRRSARPRPGEDRRRRPQGIIKPISHANQAPGKVFRSCSWHFPRISISANRYRPEETMTPQKINSAIQRRPASYNDREPPILLLSQGIHARVILPIYAKTTVALVRAACRPTLMKTYE
jgi:hypothetical protein